MSIGGSAKKPKPTPVSEGEKISAQLARDQIGYYRSNFAPLEGQFRDEAGRDHSARFSAQNAAAANRTLTGGLAAVASTGSMMDTGDTADAVTGARVAGMAQGRRERDDGRLDALGIGLGITADATKSLSEAGRLQTSAAIDRSREEVTKMQAKADVRSAALGGVAAIGTAYGTSKLLPALAERKELTEISRLRQDNPHYRQAEIKVGSGEARTLADLGRLHAVQATPRNMYRGR